jgi:hypothetical protein
LSMISDDSIQYHNWCLSANEAKVCVWYKSSSAGFWSRGLWEEWLI